MISAIRHADGSCRLDEIALLEGQELAADDPSQPHPGEESEKKHHAQDRAAIDGEEDQEQENGGKREHQVDESHQ